MQAEQQSERERFEADAGPYGFDLTRDNNVTGEPWCDYKDPETGHRWAGWLARKEPHQVPAGDVQAFEAWADRRKGASLRHSMNGGFDYPLGWLLREAFYAGAALSHPSPQGWQGMESAPKTGRTLLLGCFNSAGKWRTMRGQWMSQDYIDEYWEDPEGVEPGWFETVVESDDLPNCWPIEPTHYMPLPPPPEQGSKG